MELTSKERVLTVFRHEEPDRVPAWCGASPEFWEKAKAELNLPITAIGGIDASNGKALVDAGADMLAVIHAVLGAENITEAANEMAALFTTKP